MATNPPESNPESKPEVEMIEVPFRVLYSLLTAINGGGHLIRELQVTRNFPDNPINILIELVNAQTKKNKR